MQTTLPQLKRARWRHHAGWLWLLVGLLGGPGLRAGETSSQLESRVQAAFIVKFAAFIEWPAGPPDTNTPFVIGILGADPFGQSFDDAIATERVKGQAIALCRSTHWEALTHCDLVFVAGSERERFAAIFSGLEKQSALVVTDDAGAAQLGSMINFFKADGKVRFEFNLAALERARLKPSAKLLQAGRIAVPARAEMRGAT